MFLRQMPRRVLQGCTVFFLATTSVFIYSHLYTASIERNFKSIYIKLVEDSKSIDNFNMSLSCKIPNYDPFDPSIRPYYTKYSLVCPHRPYLTFVDDDGYIHLNKSGFDEMNQPFSRFHCEFYSINGVDGKPNNVVYGTKKTIADIPIKVEAEFIHVTCVNKISKVSVYETCHSLVPSPGIKLQNRNKKAKEQGRTNVLLLAIDSMSRLSFIRNLPKSHAFLTDQLGSVVMRGLNKVGINTHPNMIPFLSGYKLSQDNISTTPAFGDEGFYDDKPIIWKNFTQAGYVSMWLDEWVPYQLFYFNRKGFKLSPTDYYPRPFFQELELIGSSNRGFCFGNTPAHDFALDYTEKFLNTMKDTIYFAFSFIARISHDDANTVQAMDNNLHKFLERMFRKGQLNNTVLLIFGDHGLRFGEIRKTLIGTIEDRMPFMSIYLPPKLREQKPHLQSGLETNSARLLSWFDMYELLMDLAMDNLEEVSRVPRWGFNVGLSPFRPFPENRNCQEAGIPPEYCVCMTSFDIDVHEEGVQETAEQVVHYINNKLKNVPGDPCEQLSLDKVESVQLISNPQDIKSSTSLIILIRVSIWTLPNNALFQATFERRVSNQVGKIVGEVERLNKYGNQSACVDSLADSKILPFCFCSTYR